MLYRKLLEDFINESSTKEKPVKIIETIRDIIKGNLLKSINRQIWTTYLDKSGRPEFLSALKKPEIRHEWANQVFTIIQHCGFSLLDLFNLRIKEIPDKYLFHDMTRDTPEWWTYEQVNRMVRQTAAVFHQAAPENPSLVIYCENSVPSAICDLACLFYDIFVSPLSTHFKQDVLVPIFDQLKINLAVCDTQERLETLTKLRNETKTGFKIFTINQLSNKEVPEATFLGNAVMQLDQTRIESILEKRKRKPINQVATTMFTSGSTGIPKGVSFSIYNMVSKRFARHAALPFVGKNETLLCYLPLFHTFGRFLELQGMIYWRGCYTFAGNTSPEALTELFAQIQPTGFISVPLRWLQIYETIMEKSSTVTEISEIKEIIKSVVGKRLGWGLSAAGYLDPKVFSFFEKHAINLCSGFGMTEATGGITMTPPGKYRKNSTGMLLPGLESQLLENGELMLTGHYIARYLEDKGPDDIIPYPGTESETYWLNTGDVFTISDEGYYEIIDRVKDIYKNNKGQTIAPKTLEKKFEGVPGIKQTFLVGDGQPYNVLLIVPDFQSPIITNAIKEGKLNEYFHQIVMHANKDLANYERVVNFSVLAREFSAEKGELTPKGSFNRKTIQNHYKGLIESLYQTNHIRLELSGIKLLIPRWFYRDIGILENDIIIIPDGIYDRRNKKILTIKKTETDQYLIGDLIYTFSDQFVDLGRLVRQPRLWLGNPELIRFAPVKEGWDLPLKNIAPQVYREFQLNKNYTDFDFPELKELSGTNLIKINELCCKAIFGDKDLAITATESLGKLLDLSDQKTDYLLRRRLETLARHHEEEVRVMAYKILLLAEPDPDFEQIFPAFISSGLSFLTEESISKIAQSNFARQHLISLRKRLHYYRVEMDWPTTPVIREQFKNILKLLFNFACHNFSYYMTIRSEMASWALHKKEPELSALAEQYFFEIFENFEDWLRKRTPRYTKKDVEERIVFETGISQEEVHKLNSLFIDTLFLDQSVILAYEELEFNLFQVPKNGMWVSRLMSFHNYRHYRLSINTLLGKHFELHMVLSKEIDQVPDYRQLFWLSSLSGHPFGEQTLPTLGCSRMKYGIRTTKFLGELTVWEKIREYAEIDNFTAGNINPNLWRKLFIRAFATYFITIKNSNFRIIPGAVSPNNVVVPIMDFRDTSSIVTLSGMKDYDGPYTIIQSIVKEFYEKTEAHYPWIKGQIKISWIFDAFLESFDLKLVNSLFEKLAEDLNLKPIYYDEKRNLLDDLKEYQSKMQHYYLPQAVYNAIDRYKEWETRTYGASISAREQTIFELYELYKLQDLPHVVRYYLFRETYFRKSSHKLLAVFDSLIEKMRLSPNASPMQMIELSDLQNLLKTEEDKIIFSKMVFPKIQKEQSLDILKIKGDSKEQIIIKSKLKDKNGEEFEFREPLEPGEVGQLYQLFYKENYPINISKMDRHFVICDKNDRIVGGLCYKILEDKTVVLDGSVISSPIQGRGIGSAMVQDFFTRMASIGIKIIKAHFLLGNYYLKNRFQIDKKWGAFVKYL